MMPDRSSRGFSLVELLLATGLGAMLCGLAVPLLIGEVRHGTNLAHRLQQQRLQRRTLRLLQADLAQADRWQLNPLPEPSWSCAMAGRQPLIAMAPRDGGPPVVYSLGRAPSSIWRGTVLMRCGPAFDLAGRTRAGSGYLHRVVIDAVERLHLENDPQMPLLHLKLEQRLPGSDQLLRSSAVG